MKNHKVSIIMATYNRAHFIAESLESILKQTYTNWECIIIDDGGTDNTSEVLQPFLEKDNRFSFLKKSNSYKKGLPGCRNFGLDIATGDYIIFFDDDDIVHPDNLLLCVKELSKDKDDFCRYLRTVFTGNFHYKFDNRENYDSFKITNKDLDKMLDGRLPFNSCAIMWKKECFEENRFVESLMYAEEWELYSRLLSLGFSGVSIEKTLFYGRKHPNSNTGEFWRNNPVRLASKREAIYLVAQNLVKRNKLSENLKAHLLSKAINFRDLNLLNRLFVVFCVSIQEKLFYLFKFMLFPVWIKYKALTK